MDLAPFERAVTTDGPAATQRLAARLGELAAVGDVIALDGDLGAGKTCFVQGLARGLGLPSGEVHSPTFNIVLDHLGGRVRLYHIDLYRISDGDELAELGLETYLYGDGVCAVEWMSRFPSLAPPDRVEIGIAIAGTKERRLTVRGVGKRGRELAHQWLDGKGAGT